MSRSPETTAAIVLIEELVDLVLRWIEEKESFEIEGHVYELLEAA